MRSIDETAAEWVARRQSATFADNAEFQAWHDADTRHAGAFLRAEASWMLLDRAQVMTHGAASENPSLILPSRSRMPAGLITTRRTLLTGAVAASVAGAIGVGYVLRNRLSFVTQRGELRKVPLSDRSLAAINTDSEIDVAMTESLRHIQLVRGEAWFDVAKNPNAPFVVSAGDIRVRAVGTAFSVRRKTSGAEVLVTEGTVETWSMHTPDRRTRLSAGASAYVPESANATAVAAYTPDEVTRRLAWREREIVLREESLREAAADFNRYNDRQIVIADPKLNDARLVGGFSVDQPETFARAVHAALNVPVSIREDRITIGGIATD